MVTVIVCSLIIGFLIGCVLATAWCKTPADDFSLWKMEQERRIRTEAELVELRCKYNTSSHYYIEAENHRLREQVRWLERTRCPIACMCKNQTCPHCEPKQVTIFVKSPKEQEVIALLQKTVVPLEELKEKFGLK
jgi:hypothetical protein